MTPHHIRIECDDHMMWGPPSIRGLMSLTLSCESPKTLELWAHCEADKSEARRWRTLCVIAVSLSVVVVFVGDVYGAENGATDCQLDSPAKAPPQHCLAL
jgi:hypothetical protein